MPGQVLFLISLKVLLVIDEIHISALHIALFLNYRLFLKICYLCWCDCTNRFQTGLLSPHWESEIGLTYGMYCKELLSARVFGGV